MPRSVLAAAPKPATDVTGSSPARRARSWSPPRRRGRIRSPRRTSKAPIPAGPPSLWADTDRRSAPRSSNAIGRWPAAAAASTCTSTPRSRQAATTSATGCTVPTSWLAACTCTTDVSGRMASTSSPGSMRPVPSTPTTVTSPTASAPSRTAECSTAASTWWGPRSAAPQHADAIASVALLVSTTDRGRAPRSAAISSRPVSTATRASSPSAWIRPGSPPGRASHSVMAVDDLWSRRRGRGVIEVVPRHAGGIPRR